MTTPIFTAPPKDAEDIEDYALNCTRWLRDGETIAQHTVVSDDPTLTISGLTQDSGVVRWRTSGGTLGRNHKMIARVTSSAGRKAKRTILLPVSDL